MTTTRRVGALALAGLVAVAGAGCSSSGKPSTKTSNAPQLSAVAQHTTSATTATPATSAVRSTPATSGLSGTWHGQYGGGYSGTFTLTWTQTGSALSGTIKLSNPASTLDIHGTVSGTTINFGTVGSAAITYTGTVSGTSMSGHYQVAGGAGGGSWSAAKG